MKRLNEKDVVYTLEAEFDDLQVRGNCVASGDDEYDKKVEDEIIRRLENEDVWAWASVKVTASWNGIEGVDYLGGCSYRDEEDFKTPGGYWEDMKAQALEDLKTNIRAMQGKVCGVVLA